MLGVRNGADGAVVRRVWPALMTLTVAVLGGYLALLPLLRSLDGDRAFPALASLPADSDTVPVAAPTHFAKTVGAQKLERHLNTPSRPAASPPAQPAATQPPTSFVSSSVTSTPARQTPTTTTP